MESLALMLHVKVASLAYLIATAATLAAGCCDVMWYKIPNKLTYPLMTIGLVYHSFLSFGGGWLYAAAGFIFGLLILCPFFIVGGVGAGDVKLLAGIGACVGLHDVVAVFLVFGVLTAAYSAAVLLSAWLARENPWRSILATFTSGQRVEDALQEEANTRSRRLVPLAPMMATALLLLAAAAVGPWNGSVSAL